MVRYIYINYNLQLQSSITAAEVPMEVAQDEEPPQQANATDNEQVVADAAQNKNASTENENASTELENASTENEKEHEDPTDMLVEEENEPQPTIVQSIKDAIKGIKNLFRFYISSLWLL